MTLIQPIDGAYFTTAYFWVTTVVAVVLAVWAARHLDDVTPEDRAEAGRD